MMITQVAYFYYAINYWHLPRNELKRNLESWFRAKIKHALNGSHKSQKQKISFPPAMW